MIYMRMRQENKVDKSRIHRQFTIFKSLYPLLHSVVHQNILFTDTKIMAAACYLVIRSNKH